jgi:chemotaxis signal transduction protein
MGGRSPFDEIPHDEPSGQEERYAIPLSAAERVFPMPAVSPLPKSPAITLGVINLHGSVIPVLDFRSRFGFPRGFGRRRPISSFPTA